MRTSIALLACVLFATLPARAGATDAPTTADAALDETIAREMDEAGMAGVGAALIIDAKVVWMKGDGFADRERVPCRRHRSHPVNQ